MRPKIHLFCLTSYSLNLTLTKDLISLKFQNFTGEGIGLQVQIDVDHFWIKFQQSFEVQETEGCTNFSTFRLHFLWWLSAKFLNGTSD